MGLRECLCSLCAFLLGLSEIKRGVIKQEQVKTQKESSGSSSRPVYSYSLAVEGYGLRDVMGTPGVVGTRCTSNHVMEVKEVGCPLLSIAVANNVCLIFYRDLFCFLYIFLLITSLVLNQKK